MERESRVEEVCSPPWAAGPAECEGAEKADEVEVAVGIPDEEVDEGARPV